MLRTSCTGNWGKRYRTASRAWLACLILGLFSWGVFKVQAAVTLIYFRATAQDRKVVLQWETATELDNSGFYVNRSLQRDTGYEPISPFIIAKGDSLIGATYVYTDTGLTNGVTYWYKLESIDLSQRSTFHEPPVSAIPGSNFTPTPTATGSTSGTGGTSTATATLILPSRTATPTRTGTPSGGAAASTPTRTSQSQSTQTSSTAQSGEQSTQAALLTGTQETTIPTPGGWLTGTATLIPLPELTLEFPSITATVQSAALSIGDMQPPTAGTRSGWVTPARIFFIALILLIWVVLGGWFYLSMRRIE